jgi:hypothetical protein
MTKGQIAHRRMSRGRCPTCASKAADCPICYGFAPEAFDGDCFVPGVVSEGTVQARLRRWHDSGHPVLPDDFWRRRP